MDKVLTSLRQQSALTDLDVHFARLMVSLADTASTELMLAAGLASNRTALGNVCVDLGEQAGKAIAELPDGGKITAPSLQQWTDSLRASGVVGEPGKYYPLVLDGKQRLYLYRYWDYERRLANDLQRRAGRTNTDFDPKRLRSVLNRLYPQRITGSVDRQKLACVVAVLRHLCVISGGPGTGKTSTVVRILALLAEQHLGAPLVIALTAPTGKAAARLQQAVTLAKMNLDISSGARAMIPEQASTIHRLLGVRVDGASFRHHPENPLPVDVLVVDEASMVDLALMTRLMEALPMHARCILLGDRDQLASVDAGAVLGDICGEACGYSRAFASQLQDISGETLELGSANATNIADSIVLLTQNFRFGADSGIGHLANTINQGDAEGTLRLLQQGAYADIVWKAPESVKGLHATVAERALQGYAEFFDLLARFEPTDASIDQLFAVFGRFRLLTAHRAGAYGVDSLNTAVETALEFNGIIDGRETWYHGRPVMVSRNDYSLRLFNGDIGIALRDPTDNHRIRVFFLTSDGRVRRFYPGRLPAHETVYAMTVHKSQGSEFDAVVLLLPLEASPVLTRQLVYTGITRAKRSVEIWARAEVLRAASNNTLKRSSGLRDRLWEGSQ